MNKSDVVANIALKYNITKKKSEQLVNGVLDSIEDTLINGGTVQITGFGVFEVRDRAPRVGRNPRTNEEIEIEAYKKPIFKPSEGLKKLVNK